MKKYLAILSLVLTATSTFAASTAPTAPVATAPTAPALHQVYDAASLATAPLHQVYAATHKKTGFCVDGVCK